ncbi:hypothetical protein [Paenibacillus sp. UASWS1643]|uniref:hypothetical protein n=1 Tax=Paenibacillus sp. UASWS1643 TaxID=2580422 RepID=UPI0012385028|nr:hypothetical protein [Paenibacillus sp. UASWS1643]KAA8750152.1 hypothetical protein FE296_16290 [Paenibacillus sp. UASWS1643]
MVDLSTVSKRDLQAELLRRVSVDPLYVGPDIRVTVAGQFGGHIEMQSDKPREFTIVGPAFITVNID